MTEQKLKEDIKDIIEVWYPITIGIYGRKERWMDGCVGEIYNKVKGDQE